MFPPIYLLIATLYVSSKYSHPRLSCHYAIIPVVCCAFCFWMFFSLLDSTHPALSYPLRTIQIPPLQKRPIWPLQSEIASSSSPLAVCSFYWKLDLFLVHFELFMCIFISPSDCNLGVRSWEFSPYPHCADVVPKVVPYTSEGLSKTSVQYTVLKKFSRAAQISDIKLQCVNMLPV